MLLFMALLLLAATAAVAVVFLFILSPISSFAILYPWHALELTSNNF